MKQELEGYDEDGLSEVTEMVEEVRQSAAALSAEVAANKKSAMDTAAVIQVLLPLHHSFPPLI